MQNNFWTADPFILRKLYSNKKKASKTQHLILCKIIQLILSLYMLCITRSSSGQTNKKYL
jgi:hypothetical protein